MLATIPNYSTQSNDILIKPDSGTISKTGDEAVKNAKVITDAFSDTKNGGKILGDLTGQLKNLDDIQILATRITATLQAGRRPSGLYRHNHFEAETAGRSSKGRSSIRMSRGAPKGWGPIGNLLVRSIQGPDRQAEGNLALPFRSPR